MTNSTLGPLGDCVRASHVAVESIPGVSYPPLEATPFHPDEKYPECPCEHIAASPNPVYGMVRRVLHGLDLDAARFGTPAWNPFGDLVPAGARIVVKPNWVLHHNQAGGGEDCLITHASVLRAVLDYVLLARPAGVIVGDAPLQGCDFDALQALGNRAVIDFMKAQGLPVHTEDFRRTILREEDGLMLVETELRPETEYVLVDMATNSLLEPISSDARKFRVTMYDPRKMWKHHSQGLHRYLVAKEVLEADLVINLPKLKTHKKAGITAALKNLVGINGNKDYLPHHRKGPKMLGADNYERISLLKAFAEEVLDLANRHMDRPAFYAWCNRLVYCLLVADKRLGGSGEVEGSWYGNDTVWRMCLDLNRILLYADSKGVLQDKTQRTEISIGDGLVAGEGEGPLKPEPVSLGAIVAALNPAAADWVSSFLMGLDPEKIPIIRRAFDSFSFPLTGFSPSDISCLINGESVSCGRAVTKCGRVFRAPSGWRGHCELAMEDLP